MGILWFVGAVLCYRLIKCAICAYKESMSKADEYREERITELIGPPETYKTDVKHNNTEMETSQNNSESTQTPDPTQVMLETLKQIGCQPNLDKDGKILVAYQGENFIIEIRRAYARIWDPSWSSTTIDEPNLPMLKDAMNQANYGFGPTIILGDPDDEGIISVNSRLDIVVVPEMANMEAYMETMLGSFFYTKERLREEFLKLNEKQTEAQRRRRPIGFDLSETNLS